MTLLGLASRKRIYELVSYVPGIHFRELQRKARVTTGQLEYHLDLLQRANFIVEEREGRTKRLFPQGLSRQERKVLGFLRQKNLRRLLVYIVKRRKVTHGELAKYLELSLSTTTYNLSLLLSAGMVLEIRDGKKKWYAVRDESAIVSLLGQFKQSFVDKLVDRFIESWEE